MIKKIMFLIFTIAGIIPVYMFTCWIYIFNSQPKLSHIDKQIVYNQTFFLGYDVTHNLLVKVGVVILGLISVLYFGFQISKKNSEEQNVKQMINSALFIVFLIFTILSLWGIL